nr:late embryogenesis abundant protein, LEA-14 [Tanacetum cinerariifolium]
MEAKKVTSRKILKICCGFLALLMIILLVSTILLFTVFKLKHPKVTTHPTHLENVEYSLFPNVSINATIVLNVTISNRNHGSFKFRDSTAYVDYRGTLIAEIPIEHAKIPALSNFTITAYANVTAEKMVTNPNFTNDIKSGYQNFTSTATLKGK